jgi:hypothetical protein
VSNGQDFYDDDEQSNEPDWLKNLRREHRDFKRQNKELTDKVSQFQTAQRGATVQSVLQAKGVNPKVAGFVPSDIEATEEAITKWLDEYGDVFGVTAQKTETDSTETTGSSDGTSASSIDPALLATLQRIQGADSGAGAISQDADTQAAVALASIGQNAKSSADFFAQLHGRA